LWGLQNNTSQSTRTVLLLLLLLLPPTVVAVVEVVKEVVLVGKTIPLQARTGPKGSRRLRFPDLKTIGM
jgi:hypothetical protein